MADIGIAITSESVLNLKQSCQVLIDAYKRNATLLLEEDENGIFPLMVGEVCGLKTDVQAGIDSLNGYTTLSLDVVERPANNFTELSSFKDIEKIEGNYTITQSIYDDAQTEVNNIFDGMKERQPATTEQAEGSNFLQNSPIEESPTNNKRYQKTPDSPEGEVINTGNSEVSTRKVIVGQQELQARGTPTAPYQNKAEGKFGGSLLEDCIPCSLRLNNLGEFEIDIKALDPWEQLKSKYSDLASQFEGLLNNVDIIEDVCNLLNFLDVQCMPDLYGMTALLLALMRKYSFELPSLSASFSGFISPFFSPLLSGLNELLDKYAQMILGPVDCVVDSLDTQLAKLDVQRAVNQNDVQEISFHRKREGFLRRKIEGLQERKAFLTDQLRKGADANRTPPRKLGGSPRSSQSNLLRDAIETDPSKAEGVSAIVTLPNSTFTTSINEELITIDEDLKEAEGIHRDQYGQNGKNNITDLLENSRAPKPSIIGDARGSLRDVRKGLASGLYELRSQILNGKRMVNDTIRVMRDELTKLIGGRARSSEEMLVNAAAIQKISRLVGILNSLSKLKKIANNPKLCENSNGDPSLALGGFLTANRGVQQENNYYNVYVGENTDGEESLLVAPSDAVLELTDPDTGSVRQVGDLAEINKLNNDGIPKNLGNITNKKVTATVPELGTQVPVAIIAFDLCKSSNFSTEADIGRIKQWASDAGFNA